MLPYGAKEIIAVRRQGMRPLGPVIVTDDRAVSDLNAKRGFACCLLPWRADWSQLDLRFLHGLDVVFGHGEQQRRAVDLAMKIAEIQPRTLWVKNLKTKYIDCAIDANAHR